MKKIKYFIEFILIIFLLMIFKILGLKVSLFISSFIFRIIGPLFRAKKISYNNLSTVLPNISKTEKNKIIDMMWENYGKIFSEYMFIKNFRTDPKYSKKIVVENQEELEKIKLENKPVIFISGHFSNFELMAMHLEKSNINLAAIYRPLNNKFLNPIMERIRKNIFVKNKLKREFQEQRNCLKNLKMGPLLH